MTHCELGKCIEDIVVNYAGLGVCKAHYTLHANGEINLIDIGLSEGRINVTPTGWEIKRRAA